MLFVAMLDKEGKRVVLENMTPDQLGETKCALYQMLEAVKELQDTE